MSKSTPSNTVDDDTARRLRARIFAAVPAWQTDHIGEFHFLSGGYSNANYAFSRSASAVQERYVLRIPQRPQPFVNRDAEALWYERLPSSVGVQPVVLDRQTGLMISPWIEGVLLIDAFNKGVDPIDLVSYLISLHRNLPSTARRYHVPSLLPKFVGEKVPPGAAQPALVIGPAEHSARVPEPAYLTSCHNDLNPWNIVVTDAGWMTLDWEFAGANDPLFDLVSLHQGLELEDALLPEMAAMFVTDMVQSRLKDALEAFWLREWAWATFQQRSGNNRPEVISQIDTAAYKLQRLTRS